MDTDLLIKHRLPWGEIRVYANRIDIAEEKLLLPGFKPARTLIWMKDVANCYAENHLIEPDELVIVPRRTPDQLLKLMIPGPHNEQLRQIIAGCINQAPG